MNLINISDILEIFQKIVYIFVYTLILKTHENKISNFWTKRDKKNIYNLSYYWK